MKKIALLIAVIGQVSVSLPGFADEARATSVRENPCAEDRLGRLRARIEKVRGVKFSSPIPCSVQDRSALAKKLQSEWDKKSPAEWDAAETRLRHFGLLPANLSLKDALLPVLGEQVIAYYDNVEKTLTLIRTKDDPIGEPADLGAAGDPLAEMTGFGFEEITLLHELDHGFEDQYSNLTQGLERRRGQNDAENAFMALVEGESTYLMIAALVDAAGATGTEVTADTLDSVLGELELSVSTSLIGSSFGNSPVVIRESLIFPYLLGFRFSRALAKRGGWPLLNAALLSPPESSRTILHPESYGGAPEEILRFEWPRADPFALTGWTILEDQVYGEQDVAILLGKGEPRGPIEPAEGWRGDRFRLYQRGENRGESLSAGIVEFDDEPRAILFELELRRRLGALGHRVHEVNRSGKRVVLVDGPVNPALSKSFSRDLMSARSWTETCPAVSWNGVLAGEPLHGTAPPAFQSPTGVNRSEVSAAQ